MGNEVFHCRRECEQATWLKEITETTEYQSEMTLSIQRPTELRVNALSPSFVLCHMLQTLLTVS